MSQDNTPVIIGVGQVTDRLDTAEYRGLSSVELAVEAAKGALADAAVPAKRLLAELDAIGTLRTFADSTPRYSTPFGKSNNFPHSVARRVGFTPQTAVWASVGGDTPQTLVGEFFERIAAGSIRAALIAGADAISTAKHLMATNRTVDWSETLDEPVDDRGFGLKGVSTRYNRQHRVIGGPEGYALLENARRARLGCSRRAYALEMAKLFAPFSAVAARNPYSAAPVEYSVDDLATVGERNRMIADPYTRLLVARDQVNQGAAVLVTSERVARSLGVDPSRWVYLHGYASAAEPEMMLRHDLGASCAARFAAESALSAAGIGTQELSFIDLYSCFPIAVLNICDGLGLSPADPRGLTVTGGLPYFGGPGNCYSMHAIATLVEKLRASPGSRGFIGANGGFLSKYAAGVYSTERREFERCDSAPVQARVEEQPTVTVSYEPEGEATIESYTVVYGKEGPSHGIVIGRLPGGERFLANTHEGDDETLKEMIEADPLGRTVSVRSLGVGNRFAFSPQRLEAVVPRRRASLRTDFEFIRVERRDHLLEITINRPEARNCLHPPAHEELEEAFDAYFADPTLWVAILTGSGKQAFCAGADLKWGAAKKPPYLPKSGFGGLTARVDRPKPVIAAVNGFAMGGGLELCLASDLVVADADAKFALSEVRVGYIAGCGGLIRLPRRIPKMAATEMILTGRRIGADEAKSFGLICRVTPAGEALDGARTLAAEILQGSPTSVRLSLEVMRKTESIADELAAVRMRQPAIDELMSTEDYVEGPLAFSQKRPPKWLNR